MNAIQAGTALNHTLPMQDVVLESSNAWWVVLMALQFLPWIKKTFINPVIINESGENSSFEEGCLSIPNIREHINRKSDITIKYQDENFTHHQGTFSGILARVIQHEYDHIEGILFTDHLKPLKKRLLKGKLDDISKGKVEVNYKMKFQNLKRWEKFYNLFL
mgnify:CR=1 FL=1